MAEMSVEMNVVTPSIRLVGTAASSTQRRRRQGVIGPRLRGASRSSPGGAATLTGSRRTSFGPALPALPLPFPLPLPAATPVCLTVTAVLPAAVAVAVAAAGAGAGAGAA